MVDTNAIVMKIQNTITNLDIKITELEGNIHALRNSARHQKNALVAREQTTNELSMLYLFKA
jgi:hypothetical protein